VAYIHIKSKKKNTSKENWIQHLDLMGQEQFQNIKLQTKRKKTHKQTKVKIIWNLEQTDEPELCIQIMMIM
jgi:hypothetical protein